jgi:hypothetical protein
VGTQKLTANFVSTDPNIADKPASTTITVLSPVQATNQILTNVQNLVTSGVLNSGQGNSLKVKLNNAIADINAGDTKKATNELNALINQVNSFITTGVLTQAQGQPLIDEANAVINALK